MDQTLLVNSLQQNDNSTNCSNRKIDQCYVKITPMTVITSIFSMKMRPMVKIIPPIG